ncbi:hypothetical protein EYD79_00950 [Shigella sonnei]|nr:hypothetical protein [Escherichia coli]EFW5532204.1 hypothetical protein [Shigella sonnei]EFZ0655766.1 hypothetical protein [Shigella sonnei]EFZ2872809.1 hypothetical protein [Shigella sonnei]EFZ3697873.1 hypothetical protein [Shigella sonnei]
MSMIKRLTPLKELITNPASGRLSTSDSALVGAFLVTSFVLVWSVVAGRIEEWMFAAYIGAWVTQNQLSKYMAIKRAKEVPDA